MRHSIPSMQASKHVMTGMSLEDRDKGVNQPAAPHVMERLVKCCRIDAAAIGPSGREITRKF